MSERRRVMEEALRKALRALRRASRSIMSHHQGGYVYAGVELTDNERRAYAARFRTARGGMVIK